MVNFLEETDKFYQKNNEDKKNIVFIIGDGRINKELVRNKLAKI